MRVVDLDRDMSDVIPTATSVDSEFLFQRMEDATLNALLARPGARVLDCASGVGQDDRRLAKEGIWAVGSEPSARMMALARVQDAERPAEVQRVRAWSEVLPFRTDSFDGAFCKGALDHFDDPLGCVREMARVTRPQGRVVLAVANFDSLGCRLARLRDRFQRGRNTKGRRHYDVPSDHFTRYDPQLLREQLQSYLALEEWTGVSLLWGVRAWAALLGRVPRAWAERLLRLADRVAQRLPALADVIVVAGCPRS
ncbi:MAG: methyltransferase domain-containing protein, partial [Deltaproteobacteria bacterium]|nr:methyltransferase domain-containing protein [Deltaproteobacteria bacterium]